MRRFELLAFAVCAALLAPRPCSAQGNYVFEFNGLDAVTALPINTIPTGAGGGVGIWRCFDRKILYAPTKVTKVLDPEFGKYAAKVNALHIGIDVGVGCLPPPFVVLPYVLITSGDSACTLNDSSGAADFVTYAGTGGTGVAAVNSAGTKVLFEGVNVVALTATPFGPCTPVATGGIVVATVPFTPEFTVTEGEDLVVYVTSPVNTQFGMSDDEKNLCDSFSFFNNAAFAQTQMLQNEEFLLGVSLVDATTVSATGSFGVGTLGLNAQAALAPPFDAGSGGRTVSITGTYPSASSAGEVLGFATYDDFDTGNVGGHLVLVNAWSVFSSCQRGTKLPTGGPGGPVLSTAIPEMPRIVCKFDAVTSSLVGNPVWVLSTLHDTVPFGINEPWYPVASVSSGATGITGGFFIPIPAIAQLVGVELCICSIPLNSTKTALANTVNSGHSASMSYSLTFFP